MDYELSQIFHVKVRMHQRSVLPLFLFAVVVDIVTELAREGASGELMYFYESVLMNETIKGLRTKSSKWKFMKAIGSVNLRKKK